MSKKLDTRERVIFRRTFDPYMKIEKYLAIFPDDEANPGNICYVPIYKNGEKWWHECYEEGDYFLIQKAKIVHKNDHIVETLVNVLKDFYGGDYKVCYKAWRF